MSFRVPVSKKYRASPAISGHDYTWRETVSIEECLRALGRRGVLEGGRVTGKVLHGSFILQAYPASSGINGRIHRTGF